MASSAPHASALALLFLLACAEDSVIVLNAPPPFLGFLVETQAGRLVDAQLYSEPVRRDLADGHELFLITVDAESIAAVVHHANTRSAEGYRLESIEAVCPEGSLLDETHDAQPFSRFELETHVLDLDSKRFVPSPAVPGLDALSLIVPVDDRPAFELRPFGDVAELFPPGTLVSGEPLIETSSFPDATAIRGLYRLDSDTILTFVGPHLVLLERGRPFRDAPGRRLATSSDGIFVGMDLIDSSNGRGQFLLAELLRATVPDAPPDLRLWRIDVSTSSIGVPRLVQEVEAFSAAHLLVHSTGVLIGSRSDGFLAAPRPKGRYERIPTSIEVASLAYSQDADSPILIGGFGPLLLARIVGGQLDAIDISNADIRDRLQAISTLFVEPSREGPVIWAGLKDGSVHRRAADGDWALEHFEQRQARCTPKMDECGRFEVGSRTIGIRMGSGVPPSILYERCSAMVVSESPELNTFVGGAPADDDRKRLTGFGRVDQAPLLVGGTFGQVYELVPRIE